jgi:hypothetical protein
MERVNDEPALLTSNGKYDLVKAIPAASRVALADQSEVKAPPRLLLPEAA